MAKIKGMFNGFWRYRYLLWNLVSRDFKLKYRRSVLGVVWSVLNPLLMCLVYWAVFSSLMDMRGSGIDNFPVFLMCGQLLFNFFNEATSSSMSSVLSAAPLLKKVYIPKYIFPLKNAALPWSTACSALWRWHWSWCLRAAPSTGPFWKCSTRW